MTASLQRIFWAGLVASAAFCAFAQTPPPSMPAAAPAPMTGTAPAAGVAAPGEHRAHRMHEGRSPQRFQEQRAQRMEALKTQLALNASQQEAWSTFVSASQPPQRAAQRPDRAEFAKLTTPQRLDRMQALQAEHAASFSRRADATRALYATLSPQQQQTFDTQTLRQGPRHAHGPHQGPRGAQGAAEARPGPGGSVSKN
jgi:hypothetical protein